MNQRVFTRVMYHESTHSAVIAVASDNVEEATQLMLEAVRAGEGNFIADENMPKQFDFADFEENASEFPMPSKTITEEIWILNRSHFPRQLKSLKLCKLRRHHEQATTLHRRIQTGRRQASH